MSAEPCGCRIVRRGDALPVEVGIAFCPLHAAANQLVAALLQIEQRAERQRYDPDGTCRAIARLARAAVERLVPSPPEETP